MRCAVVYGRLPPEIRSEQAARFNDPSSGYDALIVVTVPIIRTITRNQATIPSRSSRQYPGSGLVVGRVFDLNEMTRRHRDLSLIVSGSSKIGTSSLRPFSDES